MSPVLETPDFPVLLGEIEVRARGGGGRTLSASFPYNRTATVASGGRVRKERFSSYSLSWQVKEFEKLQAEMSRVVQSTIDDAIKAKRLEALDDAVERRNSFMLVGHSYDRAIADMRSGTLVVEHKSDGVNLRATIPAEGSAPSWVEDTVRGIQGGQVRGVSPGFQVPTGKGAERLIPEEGNPGVMIRQIDDAVAFEYSLVSRPAYSGTTADVAERSWRPSNRGRRFWL